MPLPSPCDTLRMDVPGGSIERPAVRGVAPTFWSANSQVEAGGLRICFEIPGCVALHDGLLLWVVGRNAPREQAWGLLPVLAHPARGTEDGEQVHRCIVVPPGACTPEHPFAADLAPAGLRLEGHGRLLAVKPAHRGDGRIVRIEGRGRVRLGPGIDRAVICDARERDQREVPTPDGWVELDLQAALTSLRIEG